MISQHNAACIEAVDACHEAQVLGTIHDESVKTWPVVVTKSA
jgi:hypothetical protein